MPGANEEGRFRLLAEAGGRRWACLVPVEGVTVGSSERAGFRVEASGVSRLHARFVPAGQALWVEDRGSKNGLWIDGRRIERQAVGEGDQLRLGDATVRVERVAAADAEAAIAWPAEAVEAARGESRAPLDEPTTLVAPDGPRAGGRAAVERLYPRLRLPEEFVVGASPAMLRLLGDVERVAAQGAPVLLLGETGTGKELLARAIHMSSPRAAGPFEAINCAAIPGELLEAELFGVRKGAATGISARAGALKRAAGGTVLLDEIGELALPLQAKLLRVLEGGELSPLGGEPEPVDLRFVAATHRDLRGDVDAGRFRADLYYRLAVFPLRLPPLRERREDLPTLVATFVERFARESGRTPAGVSRGLLELVAAHSWPGNLRELSHEARRWVAFGPEGALLDSTLLSDEIRAGAPAASDPGPPPTGGSLDERLAQAERVALQRALAECGGNRSRTAKRLGISRNGLAAKLSRHGLGGGSVDASEADDDRA
jgi:DNA-binding NtrC family response regulator